MTNCQETIDRLSTLNIVTPTKRNVADDTPQETKKARLLSTLFEEEEEIERFAPTNVTFTGASSEVVIRQLTINNKYASNIRCKTKSTLKSSLKASKLALGPSERGIIQCTLVFKKFPYLY